MAFRILSGKEMCSSYIERMKKLNDMVKVEDGVIVLDGYYQIELSRCDTAEKLLGWVVHLNEKNWIDGEIINRFVKIASHYNNIEIVR